MITLIFDRAATEFGRDDHPERPARLINTQAYLLDKHPDWVWKKPRSATPEEVLRVHRPEHLERLRQPMDFDADTPYYPGIDEHARRAAGDRHPYYANEPPPVGADDEVGRLLATPPWRRSGSLTVKLGGRPET